MNFPWDEETGIPGVNESDDLFLQSMAPPPVEIEASADDPFRPHEAVAPETGEAVVLPPEEDAFALPEGPDPFEQAIVSPQAEEEPAIAAENVAPEPASAGPFWARHLYNSGQTRGLEEAEKLSEQTGFEIEDATNPDGSVRLNDDGSYSAVALPKTRLEVFEGQQNLRDRAGDEFQRRKGEALEPIEREREKQKAELAAADERTRERVAKIHELTEVASKRNAADEARDDMGLGTKIAHILAAFAGGLLSSRNGGKNPALDALTNDLKQRTASKRGSIERQIMSLNKESGMQMTEQEFRHAADRAENQEYLRSVDKAIAKVKEGMNDFDREGVQFMERYNFVGNLESEGQKVMADQRERDRKHLLEQGKLEVDAYKAESENAKRQAEIGKLQAETRKLNARGTGGKKSSILTTGNITNLGEAVEFAKKSGGLVVPGRFIQLPNGQTVPYVAHTQKQAEAIRSGDSGLEVMLPILSKLEDSYRNFNYENPGSNESGRRKAMRGAVLLQLRPLLGGPLDEGMERLVNELVGESSGGKIQDYGPRIEVFRNALVSEVNSRVAKGSPINGRVTSLAMPERATDKAAGDPGEHVMSMFRKTETPEEAQELYLKLATEGKLGNMSDDELAEIWRLQRGRSSKPLEVYVPEWNK